MADLPHRIRELRESEDLSQQALADIIGVSKSSINMYERGEREPKLQTMEALADHFNVDMNYLTGWSDDRIDYNNPELIASIPLSYMELCNNDVERAWKMMQAVDEDALAELSKSTSHASSEDAEDFGQRLFAAAGDVAPEDFSENAIADVADYMRFVAEKEKEKNKK